MWYFDANLIYVLYYLVVYLGVIEIAKRELYNSNKSISAIVLSLILGVI